VGFLGAKPLNRSPQRAKYLPAPTFCEAKLGNKSLLLFFAERCLRSALESEFFGGKPKKREALQERASLTAAKLLLSYGDKSKL